jgi:pyridoxal phosphate enzyme (YggS family)
MFPVSFLAGGRHVFWRLLRTERHGAMGSAEISANLTEVRRRIETAALAAGRNPHSVRLVAVSKTVDVDSVRCALAADQEDFGENQVQELARKSQLLPSRCLWHLIGHLQANKVRTAVRAAAWIHSVDSIALVERIGRLAAEEGRQPIVLLQANLSGEPTKSGVSADSAGELLRCALRCPGLSCRGLMTMAPFAASESELHAVFGGLRELRDRLQEQTGALLPELSMGMSGDFSIAIEEGATLVRIGTAIFGPRE